MGSESTVGLTYADLEHFPDDGLRREIIDGVLHVTAAPVPRHQRVGGRIFRAFAEALEARGGEAFYAPVDVVLSDVNVVEPDVIGLLPERVALLGERNLPAAPDIAVEVSSPSTKGADRIKKRALYERFGVPEYWIVDLDDDVIEAYVLEDGQYGPPRRFTAGDTVTSAVIDGFAAPFEEFVPPG